MQRKADTLFGFLEKLRLSDDIGYYALLLHCIKDLQRTLRLLPFLAGAYQSVVGNDIRYYALLLHCIEDLQRTLRLLCFLAGAYQCTVGDNIGHYALLLHFPESL